MFNKNKKFALINLIIILSTILLSGCPFSKTQTQAPTVLKNVNIQVWNLFDNSSIFEPLFSEFKSKHPGLNIEYRKFDDPDEYLNLIVNEMAEGKGPDIFFINNAWITQHYKKINPANINFIPPKAFRDTFVSVAGDDFIIKGEDGVERVYGMPLYIDNLAMYYNKDHFEEKLSSTGKPAPTWEGVKDQVFKLTTVDNSFERFARSGIAMGRTDNISRAYDIFSLLLLQSKTNFYNPNGDASVFANQQGVSSAGQAYFPARDAMTLYTGFAIPNNKQYAWNRFMANPTSKEKELTPFANGKVSMMVGYSYSYQDIINQIDQNSKKGIKTIDPKKIGISEIPQIFDANSGETKVTLANYFAPTVARTSQYPDLSWQLINFLAEKDNMKYYFGKTHKPSARRDLIEEESADPIYGVFAKQIGFAKDFKIANATKYKEIFTDAINGVIDSKIKIDDALRDAQTKITELISEKPVYIKVKQVKSAKTKGK